MKQFLVIQIPAEEHKNVVISLPPGSTVLFSETKPPDSQGEYSFTFGKDNPNWSGLEFDEYNWMFLRQQQSWANDMLRARGYVLLDELLRLLGVAIRPTSRMVGWVYKVEGSDDPGFIDFGCWEREGEDPEEDGSIKLQFNVQGPIWSELE